MTSAQATPCGACGAPGTGKFCSTCGAPREGAACSGCGAPVSPAARFCSRCGLTIGATPGPLAPDRTPWIVAAVAMAGLLAVLLIMLVRKSPGPPEPVDVAAGPS